MATLQQILSPVWSYGLSGGGAVAEGLAAIRQCIDIIIRTTPGTDPMRPEFGSNVYKYQDYPADVAIPNIKKAILEAIALWERRVVVTSITHTLDVSRLYLNVTYKLTDDVLTDIISIIVSNGGISTGITPKRLILQGYFPPNPNQYQYTISCILDGAGILPVAPANGFPSVADLFQWVRTNWLNYGQWYLNTDSIVGYINPQYSTGSLTISLINLIRFTGGIPGLGIGNIYTVSITVDGTIYSSSNPLYTSDDIRQWAQENVGGLGEWQLLSESGAFNDDFNDDFNTYSQLLVIYTGQAESVIIDITTQPE